MRQRAAATIAALTLAGALLINFKSPAETAAVVIVGDRSSGTSGSTSTGTSSGSGASSRAPGGSTTTGSTSGTAGSGASTASGTFSGPVAANPYGDVQVQITVANGKITDVQALALPTGGHSGRISSFVAPILRSQALTVQSAAIDGVSGASYTSQAYAQSLQGALDKAGL